MQGELKLNGIIGRLLQPFDQDVIAAARISAGVTRKTCDEFASTGSSLLP